MRKPLFKGLVFDENDQPVEIGYVGQDPCYIINDAGFRRYVPSEQVDRQILDFMKAGIAGNEDIIIAQTAKMLGQEDLFSKAIIENQIKNIDKQFEQLLQTGIPEEGLTYMGMTGFKVLINFHGEVVDIHQPGIASSEDEGE